MNPWIVTSYFILFPIDSSLNNLIIVINFRFIQLPLIVSDCKPKPGPASKTLYSLPPHLVSKYPEINHPAELRAELSLAYSRVHFLKPHAIVMSHLEDKPLSDYADGEAVNAASLLYTYPRSPIKDLLKTQAEVVSIWKQYHHIQNQQIRKLRSFSQSLHPNS